VALAAALWEEGFAGLLRDKTRPPGKAPLPPETVARVLAVICSEPPAEVTYWSGRAVATLVGVALRSVQRIWDAHRLQPHRVRTFKRSSDPAFSEKVEDIEVLYMNPSAHAVVLSIDEKSQIQALGRTRPGTRVKPGRPATMTHDYERHGTTTLFAALDVLEGTNLGRCMQRHRHQEFIRFLNAIEASVPVGKVIHAILDNYAVNKHPRVRAWLSRHRRGVFHFTPTSASWMNALEGFFWALTRRRLTRGLSLAGGRSSGLDEGGRRDDRSGPFSSPRQGVSREEALRSLSQTRGSYPCAARSPPRRRAPDLWLSSHHRACEQGTRRGRQPDVNHKRIFRIMRQNSMLLAEHTGRRTGRVHDGKVIVMCSNLRWCSDGFEIGCWNGDLIRIAFIIDAHDREIIAWHAVVESGISGSMVWDMMLEAVESRFDALKSPVSLEWLTDNGSAYTAMETRDFATALNLIACFTPVQSPESNGMSESFIITFKRD
jgi:transposase InsO family protein